MDKIGIGVDIGGTEIKAALFDLISGKMVQQRMVPTEDGKLIDESPAFVRNGLLSAPKCSDMASH